MANNMFKEVFATFVRSRHFARHFRRFAILDILFMRGGNTKEVPQALSGTLIEMANTSPEELFSTLNTSHDGLSNEEANKILEKVGPNEFDQEKPLPWWMLLWHCYKNPFNLLLTLLALISFFTNDMKSTTVIGSMVLLSTFLRFWQEGKSNKAANELKEMVSNTASVVRRKVEGDEPSGDKYYGTYLDTKNSAVYELPIKLLVPGDIVLLAAGDMIPADMRILDAKDLFVSQAAMTGESLPVEKFPSKSSHSQNPLEIDNLVFMGTNVVSGSALALVLATGSSTYFGAIAQRVILNDTTPTAFQTGINKVSWLLIRFMMAMVPLVLLINGFAKGNWLEAFLFAMSVAIGLTPEMLPMIVTSTLAKGAVILSRKKVIVKRLEAIQNFGAMNILCTDKTGTLTQDKIFLERSTDLFGESSDTVMEMAYLNSFYQTGLKNLLDVAVLEHAEVHKELEPAENFRKVDEIPFDFMRRRMSVVVAEHDEHHLLICKGAVEEILEVCTLARHGEDDEPLTDELLAEIREVTASLNQEGLRVVAVAAKDLPPVKESYGIADECDLTLLGYIAFLDPPKETTAPALAALKDHGVDVKILTGDNELVTAKICREVDFEITGVLLGPEIENMDNEALIKATKICNIFARLTPIHKERIVRAIKNDGHVVGFMGDGINDAPALRAADIGISVDSAVDIAKEAADIILLEKSLMVLEEGVIEGRKTFINMLKYIKMTASSNFGNVFSVLIASIFLPFLPMLPMQLLVQNLLYDISQIGIPFDNVDEELIKKPQSWHPVSIGRFMLFFGPISSIFDITTFLVMWFVFGANSPENQTLFQSGWFVVGLLTQTLIVHMIRTPKVAFIQSRASATMLIMTLLIMLAGVFIPMGPFADYFKFQALPPLYFVYLIVVLAAYTVLAHIMKNIFIRKFGWQ